jgi:hypothetical protein
VLPVPLAAGLYGILLGLGFTTFVLTFAVWALAAVAIALGDPAAGLLIGLGFGAGRALPVVLLAPANGTARGIDAHAAMAERPVIYRSLRAVDAVALVACAVALGVSPAEAGAQSGALAAGATDPSAEGDLIAYDRPGRAGVLVRAGVPVELPGRDPAVSGAEVAWREGDAVVIADAATLQEVGREVVPGADAFAFNANWIVWRADRRMVARPRGGTGAERVLEALRDPSDVGAPSLDGDTAVYHLATRSGSALVASSLASGTRTVLRRGRGALLLNPVLRDGELLYVRSTRARQQLVVGYASIGSGEQVLYETTPTARRDAGREPGKGPHTHRGPGGTFVPALPARPAPGTTATLWTSALTPTEAYVTRVVTRRVRGRSTTTSSILRVAR